MVAGQSPKGRWSPKGLTGPLLSGRRDVNFLMVNTPSGPSCPASPTHSVSSESPVTFVLSQKAKSQRSAQKFWAQVFVYITLWWTASILVIMVIKTTVEPQGIYPHSFAFTSLCQPTTGFLAWLVAQFVYKTRPTPPKLTRREWGTLLVLGTIQGLEIGLTNKALQYLSVASRTMISSMGVLFMMISAWLWRLEKLGVWRLVSCAFLVAGGVFQGLDQSSDNKADLHLYMAGVGMQLVSMLCSSQRWALAQFVMQLSPPESGLGQTAKLQLLSMTLPITGVVCLPFVLTQEPHAYQGGQLLQMELPVRTLLVAVGLTAMLYAELKLVKRLSAVAFNVLSTVHQIPIVLVGVVFQHNRVGEFSACGFAMCILGALVYAWARRVELKALEARG